MCKQQWQDRRPIYRQSIAVYLFVCLFVHLLYDGNKRMWFKQQKEKEGHSNVNLNQFQVKHTNHFPQRESCKFKFITRAQQQQQFIC